MIKVKNGSQFHKNVIFSKNSKGDYLFDCDFCLRRKVRANRNFHIRNRNKVQFWTKKPSNKKLICLNCLFKWKEIEIDPNRKDVFKVYKTRYLKELTIKDHGSRTN